MNDIGPKDMLECFKGITDHLEHFNGVIDEAGGSSYNYEELENMSALWLITLCKINNINFEHVGRSFGENVCKKVNMDKCPHEYRFGHPDDCEERPECGTCEVRKECLRKMPMIGGQ